jgi:LysR family transcriptional activator of glutamate synthase operon
MLKHAHRSISEINSATERIAALRDPDSGTVRFAFLHSLASWLVPDLLRRFRSAAPRVQFTLRSGRGVRDGGFLARGHVDLCNHRTRPDGTGFGWHQLQIERLCLVVRRDHRFAQRARLRLAEAADEPFIAPNWVASVEELIDYDRIGHVPTRTRARPDGSDTERMEVCHPVSEASPASW